MLNYTIIGAVVLVGILTFAVPIMEANQKVVIETCFNGVCAVTKVNRADLCNNYANSPVC